MLRVSKVLGGVGLAGVIATTMACSDGSASSAAPTSLDSIRATTTARAITATTCSGSGSARLGSSTRTRVMTEALVIRVDKAGRASVSRVEGLNGPVSARAPAGEDLRALTSLLPAAERADLGSGASPALDPDGWTSQIAGLSTPVDLIWFSGVDRIDGTAVLPRCPEKPSDRKSSTTRKVSFTTWTMPALGLLECGTRPPADSTAALAEPLCP